MGRFFRDAKHPNKYVLIGKRRVKDGECAAVWDSKGNYRIEAGPKLLHITCSDVRFLDRLVAHQNEFLIVKFKDGRKQHVRGPHALYLDPVQHASITVHKAVELNDYEAVIVYTEIDPERDAVALLAAGNSVLRLPNSEEDGKDEDDYEEDKGGAGKCGAGTRGQTTPVAAAVSQLGGRSVQRRIVMGPTLFVPSSNEWIHEFAWHGRVPDNKARYKAGMLKFQKVRTLPSTMYYNVSECRTSDDAELEVKLMIFYHMNSLQCMLDHTHDPIGEILNGVCADVIRFSSDNTFLSFVQRTSELNDLGTFQVLQQRAAAVGFTIDKVVFRGYKASDQLQAMHDQAIKTRTKLRLESESVEQEQELLEMKLGKQLERASKEQEMERGTKLHALEISAAAHKQRVAHQAEELEMNREHAKKEQEQELVFLQTLSSAGVDVTKYLCSKNQRPDSVKVVRIEGNEGHGGESSSIPHVHVGD